ncbi:MAG: MFS transporter [Proteobacteria bacterium]|nr:MFS transporter [Pseudomonadota bacterium]
MKLTQLALLSVVFLDIMSQGLVIPILNTVIMDPHQDFLPSGTTLAIRQFDFGLTMAVFFLAWFFGAAYISKISDFIGRKAGMLICLFGSLLGYILTIIALDMNSLTLMVIARIVSGFTAGNQPIAQAALADMSSNEQQKTRYMGLVLFAVSIGMIAGPLISGLLSDQQIFGSFASTELPFYIVSAMVVANIILIMFFYHEQKAERPPFQFRPIEIFLVLFQTLERPLMLRLVPVFFFGQLSLSGFYIFMDTYYFSRYQFDTLQNAMTLVVLGLAMAITSTLLVGPAIQRFGKSATVWVSLLIMAASTFLSILNPHPIFAYVLIAVYFVPFALYYPTMLTLFSSSVQENEQGWAMGVAVALFTLSAGGISLLGGWLMSINLNLPFLISGVSAVIGAMLIGILWRRDDVKALLKKQDS